MFFFNLVCAPDPINQDTLILNQDTLILNQDTLILNQDTLILNQDTLNHSDSSPAIRTNIL